MSSALVFRLFAVVVLLAVSSSPSHADDRSALTTCQALMVRAAQSSQRKDAAAPAKVDAEIERCRIVIREWTLRDSRMLVDENGRPQR